MKTRQVLIIISSLILFFILFFFGEMRYQMGVSYGEQNAEQLRKDRMIISKQDTIIPKFVNTKIISNETVPLTINSSGRVVSMSNINISTEVQGKLTGIISLKKGAPFKKGQTLIKIDDKDAQLALVARKSNYLSVITSSLPDLKIDYPDDFEKWATFFSRIYVNKPLPEMPVFNNSKEKNFIISRNILSEYYNIKSDEAKLSKYTIQAPFEGSIIETFTDEGAVVNPGTPIIKIIRKGKLEIEIPIPPKYINKLKIGNKVHLLEGNSTFNGRITRIGDFINPSTQNLSVYVEISNLTKNLYDGMYVKAIVFCEGVENVAEIPRRAVFNKNTIYTVNEDNLLIPIDIEIKATNENSIFVRGLPNSTRIVIEPIINAKDSMKVNVKLDKPQNSSNP